MGKSGVRPMALSPGSGVVNSKVRRARSAVWEIVRPRLGLLLLCLVLIAIGRLAALVLPFSTKYLIDQVIGQKQLSLLPKIIAVVLGATAIQALAVYAVTQLLSKTAWRLITDLRIQVQEHITRLPVAFFDANRTGNLVSRVMSDVEGVRNLVGTGVMEFAGGLLTAIFAFVLAMRISVMITLIVIGFMAAFGLLQRKVFSIIRPIARERGSITAEVTGRLTESFSGIRVVKSYRAEARESQVFSAGANRLLENVLRAISKTSLTTVASTAVVGIVAAVLMTLGAHQIMAGKMTLGDYIFFSMLLAMMVSPMVQIVSIGTQLTEAVAGIDRTIEILSRPREDDNPRRTQTIDLDDIRGHVSFRDVSFGYVEGKQVLHNISFEAKPGTVTALVGSSGAGKSTIISLVSAFNTPTDGRILLDGYDLSTLQLGNFRSRLGVVLQESFLFEGTIFENIAFANPRAEVASVMEAARIARVDEFVSQLPERYETVVGERGIKLSGGQRQRVSIARAILADPRILILDEATSSLDSESEAMIQEGLSYLIDGRTTFVIAHRLSTIRSADQILVIEGGRIVESGTHTSLYRDRGRYYDLYTRQHALESNLFLAPGEGDVPDAANVDQTPVRL